MVHKRVPVEVFWVAFSNREVRPQHMFSEIAGVHQIDNSKKGWEDSVEQ